MVGLPPAPVFAGRRAFESVGQIDGMPPDNQQPFWPTLPFKRSPWHLLFLNIQRFSTTLKNELDFFASDRPFCITSHLLIACMHASRSAVGSNIIIVDGDHDTNSPITHLCIG